MFLFAGKGRDPSLRESMCNYHSDHVEEEDEYETDESADDMVEEHHDQGVRDSDPEHDDYRAVTI